MKIIPYIIYSNADELPYFIHSGFTPVPTMTTEQINLFQDKSALFNIEKAEKISGREIAVDEIARSLSHIQCWRAIAENDLLQDSDFALVAESQISFVEDILQLAEQYANHYSSYAIIKLDHQGNAYLGERLFEKGDKLYAIVYSNINEYNNGGGLYLIRKDLAKHLVEKLRNTKPYWLANQFSEIHTPNNIAQAFYLLGKPSKQKTNKAPQNPLFSIIIPIYNVQNYLAECIDSVLAQNYQNYEIILVNDGSTDNSIDICEKYVKQYEHITLIHKINGGLSDARNAGIHLARGEYLIFLDSDDYWEGQNILSDLERIADKKFDVIIHGFATLHQENKRDYTLSIPETLSSDYTNDFSTLVNKHIFKPSAWTKVVRRELILQNQIFFPKGKNHEDLDWSFELATKIKTYAIYNSYFYIYRIKREGAITEYIKPRNVEDLLDIHIEKVNKLNKESIFYSGLLTYLAREKQYAMDAFKLLTEEDKTRLNEKYQTMLALFEKHQS